MALDSGEDTKRRLLDAAGEVFSRQGYKAATVRTICRMAGANVAAVHYHFGGKEGLYSALLSEAFETGLRRYPPDMGLPADAPAEARLYAFIHSFLLRMLGEGKSAWCGKLMDREMRDPTPALDSLVQRHILPLSEQLRGIVAQLLGNGAEPDAPQTRLCAMSIAGQCQYVFRSKAIIDRLAPEMRFDEAGIRALAGHITRFSLCALKNFADSAEMADKIGCPP
ncbi:MAG: CerR family C-terminal domain-containing protein [Humidesulfovibrio sp.]|uniref:CerR family C-terminal domain-containing protein n=1 Tax=Humidesulfovibrio sp. TaxID=2910988 RepID=UPI0027F63A74|nr:CerR family C-terminal domain-containing protein [Humidesulfovibrio sp.]MDQ7833902.1 CerR family C-terminal domain-containing protein [Humidesulfovibrio sp.]